MRYLLRKFGILLFTLWVAATLNFILPRLVPGDPIGAMIAKYQGKLDTNAIEALKVAYGLNDQGSLLTQYFGYLGDLLRGDFGRSIVQFPTPVIDIVKQAAPWTIGLVGVCTVLAFFIGSAFGLYSAWRRGTPLADALPPIALFLNSMPYFWFALILLYVLAFRNSIFPLGGALAPFVKTGTSEWWRSLLLHAVLPALTIIVTSAGGWLITMRNNVMGVMSEDYIAFARAKGLSEGRLLRRYVLRNALLPSFTAFGMALGFVVGGSILTETVFSYPGLGLQLYNAVTGLDYPLMQALFLFIAAAVLIANFIVDLLYASLDPRVRDGKAE
ncbi:peptide/nickel transport system permease protein [Deinococcus reticulitermitis]|uniref:Peptide/nickel transport system permease protein n=1 Tax=Deinococcus reticulitermitis TaxID=856736 RepID=A0A1H7C1Y1_9DEIO|nr:ABC transporter permease [Deinococcus reticulitermitis]SEJ83701.1 peptide/nickel transport system permease protein [Deinococcus reticulitermitis]